MKNALTTGSLDETTLWIKDSSLSPAKKRRLLSFVNRYPSLNFYKISPDFLRHLPQWLAHIRQVVGGVEAGKLSWVQIDNFEHQTSKPFNLDDFWYQWVFATDISTEFDVVYFEGSQLLILTTWLETLQSNLAVKLNGEDEKIYEFDYYDIMSTDSMTGELKQGNVSVAFDSYFSFLDHITAIKIEREQVIKAQL